MKTRASASALLAILALVWWGSESAALFGQSKILSTNDLTEQADVVAVGQVSAMESEWNADKSRIVTRVTINVREFLKGGGSDQSLVVLTPGGEVGDVGEIYSGTARFCRDEEVVVFAHKKSGRDHEVVGGSQGRLPIREDTETGVKRVQGGIRLDDFCTQVRSAIQAAAPEEKRP